MFIIHAANFIIQDKILADAADLEDKQRREEEEERQQLLEIERVEEEKRMREERQRAREGKSLVFFFEKHFVNQIIAFRNKFRIQFYVSFVFACI